MSKKKKNWDYSQDYKGITALGYAIGANRIAVVKLLLDSRANPYAVDSSGNSGLHYAAGYGRKELLESLGGVGPVIPSGKRLHNYGKASFFMGGKSTINDGKNNGY